MSQIPTDTPIAPTTPSHHLGDDLILAYATGELDQATSLLVATHMALCPQCRGALELAEMIGGDLIESEPESPVENSALDSLFARIDGADGDEISVAAPARAEHDGGSRRRAPILPQPLRDAVGSDADSIAWKGVGGGVRQFPLKDLGGKAKARLLFIPAAAKVPDHGHRGRELTLVLSGSFYDEGAWFHRGDVEEADATIEHQPIAGPEEPCICLAITDAPLRFRGLIPRLAQPFLGI